MKRDSSEMLLDPPQAHAPGRMVASWLRSLRKNGPAHSLRQALAVARRELQSRRYDLNLRRLTRSLDSVGIDRPVFMLGVQGGGGTMIARTLYRHPRAVYAGGNAAFWAGQDEIHNCRHTSKDLPESLVHRSAHFRNVAGRLDCHPLYGYQRAWLYAIDEFLPVYGREAADSDAETAAGLQRVIRKIILAYAPDPDAARFVDMSQLYTIQVSYIAELLRGTDPRFILLTRNPYITCARAARKEYDGRGTRVALTAQQKVRCVIEHWHNSHDRALSHGESSKMIQVRYEDFLEDPEREIRRMCTFAELEFHPGQVPQAGQKPPLGSVSPEKWYPLKRGENALYLDSIGPELVRALNERSAELIERLGYDIIRRGA